MDILNLTTCRLVYSFIRIALIPVKEKSKGKEAESLKRQLRHRDDGENVLPLQGTEC
jgi:hypothetical protein